MPKANTKKVGRKVSAAAARAAAKGIGWGGAKLGAALATPFDKQRRDAWLLKQAERTNKRRRWVGLDGTNKPSRQPTIKQLVRGGWRCLACGVGSNDLRDRAQHKCDPAKVRKKENAGALDNEVRKTKERVKRVRRTHGTGPRPTTTTTASPPGAATAMGGARIVRSNTAAERFAYLAEASPETAHELEQLFNDMVLGALRLSQEIADLAERLDLDKRVVDGVIRAGEQAAEMIEPIRSARTVFRVLYAPFLDSSGVQMPRNAAKFFEQKTA
jgi:hypothetical protein